MRRIHKRLWQGALIAGTLVVTMGLFGGKAKSKSPYLSPCALAPSADGKSLYVAETTAGQISVFDLASSATSAAWDLPAEPTGMVLGAGKGELYVTCGQPAGMVYVVSTASGKTTASIPVGYGACGPALSPDGSRLYVCNRFQNDVSVIDTATRKVLGRVPAQREPVACGVTPDGALLYVANLLPAGRADADEVFANVTVIDAAALKPVRQIPLPNGSTGVHGLCVSPDGKIVYVVHILARFHMPTTQLERGWMNTNALTLIDAKAQTPINTVLLDDVDCGAANPWAVTCTPDSATVLVTHAGSQELSVINAPKLLEKLAKMPKSMDEVKTPDYTAASIVAADVPNDLSYLVDLRERVRLPGNGPRAVALVGTTVFTAHYFSDSLSATDIAPDALRRPKAYALGPEAAVTSARKGEMFFHDASLCFQQWQSCSTCHPDARVEGLNWDLLNDGMGNPKNTRSMLLSHKTPPVMSLGVRDTAEVAVRSGIKFIQFAVRPEEDACAIDEYLKSLEPVPSPLLEDGKLNAAAKRGEKMFKAAGCGTCHRGAVYTDLKGYDLGYATEMEKGKPFDTPTLIECWRTAPYLYDGRAATIRDVLKTCNPADTHGTTSKLTEAQLADLEAYVLSL